MMLLLLPLLLETLWRRVRGLPPLGRAGDARWRGGVFYVNRADPALWVKKRVGIGYTLNFGHRSAWGVVALAVAATVGTVALLFWR